MRVVGLFVRNRLRKIHRVNESNELMCGSDGMLYPNTRIQPLAAENVSIMSTNLRLICGNCWSSKTIKVVLNPNENRLSL